MIKLLLILLGYPYRDDEASFWQKNKRQRFLLLNKILKQQQEIGFNKEELEKKYGPANTIYSSGAWSYDVPKLWARKKKRVLNFYFNLEDKVSQIRLKQRVRY